MERLAIIARLKEGTAHRAAQLIDGGPPFELAEIGLTSHSVFLSAEEVVFIFEGHQVEWLVDGLIDDPFQHEIQRALDEWRAIADGPPRIAREQFGWRGSGGDVEPALGAIVGTGDSQ
jgi:hypothetical protein